MLLNFGGVLVDEKLELIRSIARKIKQNNGRALLVGGCVRDKFLGIETTDYDVEVYKIPPRKLIEIIGEFGKVEVVGNAFGVLKLSNGIDVSIPRKEDKIGKGHNDFFVLADPNLTYKEAGERRDLTINSIMMDPLTCEVIDCYDGQKDIEKGVIKYIDRIKFMEDPLRVLRVARLAAKLEFEVNQTTSYTCYALIPELKHLSKERIFGELEKILMTADKPSIAFRWMYKYKILETLFPELNAQASIKQGSRYHPEGVVFEHCMLAIDAVPIEERTLPIMLGILLHDTGKATCESKEAEGDPTHIHFPKHEVTGVETAGTFMRRITNSDSLMKQVYDLVVFHMLPYALKTRISDKLIKEIAMTVDLPSLLTVHRADKCGRGIVPDLEYVDEIERVYEKIQNTLQPIIMGRHLRDNFKMKPCKEFGVILKDIFEAQIEGKFNNLEGGLEYADMYLSFYKE
jgi:tRNA nucleotidyltransferase (CCA-adding enzyme)